MNTTMTAHRLQVRRLIKASRARVFDAWIKPELVMKWLGSTSCQVTSAQMDVRAGGEYAFHVHSADHEDKIVKGTYQEVTPPARLVFTWCGTCAGIEQKDDTLVTVDFVDKNGATEVCITHERFANAEICEGHHQGWKDSLEKMEKLLGGKA